MSKSVLLSIRPKWCELIGSGDKTIEVRKTRPALPTPFKVYIYCTNGKYPHEDFLCFDAGTNKIKAFYGGGMVIGEFICDKIPDICISCSDPNMNGLPIPCTGLTDKEIMDYLGNGKVGYGWHISNLVIYDEPKDISAFKHWIDTGMWSRLVPISRAPQSWCYVEVKDARD